MNCRTAAATGAVLVLLVAACSDGGASSPEPSREPGPAEAYLEAALGVTADDAAERSLRMEEQIAACMTEQGFEYIPYVAGHHFVDTAEIDPPPGTRGFAETYGYGFAAMPEEMVSETTGENPNDAIMAAMSADEYRAYELAFWGFTYEDAADSEDGPELGGCFGSARDEVWGNREEDPVRVALEEEIARIDAEAAPMDPVVLEAAAAWSTCMSDAGHPGYASPPDAEAAAWDAWLAFNGAIALDPTLGAEAPDGGLAGEGDLAAKEAALATADWDCQEEAGYDDAWQEARDRLQQEYVDVHRAELEVWVESFS